jgi:hypothetical protein
MVAYSAQRLQTNASWAAQFTFTGIDLTGWEMTGRAKSTKNSQKFVDLSIGGGQLVLDDAAAGTFSVRLTPEEAAELGEGTIIFEIMRDSPTPRRPVLRFTVRCHPGIAS